MHSDSKQTVMVLGTGGTIAGLAANPSDDLSYTAGQVSVEQLLKSVPKLNERCQEKTLQHEQLCNIDSKNMGFAQWRMLAQRCVYWLAQDLVAGIVVTHGTDTIEETAFFLHLVLAASKPVVLTCAMRPASSIQADGPSNLADALSLVACAQTHGVMVACAGRVFSAQDVQKMHSYWLNAFCAGDSGALAYVEHGQIRQLRPWPKANSIFPAQALPSAEDWPRVEIVWSHVGMTPDLILHLCAQGVHGLVIAAMGGGTISDALVPHLLQAQANGIAVVRASRCAMGRVWSKQSDTLPASTLSPLKARIALLLELLQKRSG